MGLLVLGVVRNGQALVNRLGNRNPPSTTEGGVSRFQARAAATRAANCEWLQVWGNPGRL
eukprot:scaffold326596_cov53-Tisochrysis_lutea.AAC.1